MVNGIAKAERAGFTFDGDSPLAAEPCRPVEPQAFPPCHLACRPT
jgi:hypothetical protein